MKESFVFTVPPPYARLPITAEFKRGSDEDAVKNLFVQIFNSDQLKNAGFSEESASSSGTTTILRNPTTFQFDVISKSGTEYPKEFSEKLADYEQEVVRKIFDNVRTGTQYPVINGALGDMDDCDGIVEGKIKGKNGETLTKIFGCSLLFKGYPIKEKVEGMRISKSLLSAVPREIFLKSWAFKVLLPFVFMFSPKTFLRYVRTYANVVYRGMAHLDDEPKGRVERELKRAMDAVLEWEIKKTQYRLKPGELLAQNYNTHHPWAVELCLVIANVMEFFYFLIGFDTAYRFRFQDVIAELDQTAVYKSPKKEIMRLFSILIDREDKKLGKPQIRKYKAVRTMVWLALTISPRIRRILGEFLKEVNLTELFMDESDRYFSLRRSQYNYRGESLEQRLAEADRTDKDRKHTRVQLVILNDEQGNKLAAVKVVK